MKHIQVIGLGAGELDQLSLGAYKALKEAKAVYVRTENHPLIKELKNEGISFTSFDEFYERNNQFQNVYKEICVFLLALEAERIVYAVPGHPLVAEQTIQYLLQAEQEGKCELNIIGSQSFLDDLFVSLGIDPIDGFQFLDATSFNPADIQLRNHLIFCQVYDTFTASEVKLALLEKLPADYEVTIIDAAGTSFEKRKNVPLHDLDRVMEVSNLTSVYIPPVTDENILNYEFRRLRDVIATLRGPEGCPWDKEQTHESLRKYLLEEAYELIEAIHEEDDQAIIEELGDVLLQVMLHAQIGEDEGYFSIDDVILELVDKMIRRHPHVFGSVHVENTDEVLVNWNEIKATEKSERNSLLAGIPGEWTALLKANELQKRAAKVGFDWKTVEPMWEKVKEEIEEFQQEQHLEHQEDEFGDILFALVNVARYYGISPELALTKTNEKFQRRFQHVEACVKDSKKSWDTFSLEELDTFWNEAKRKEKGE